jgi:hypothetical protein
MRTIDEATLARNQLQMAREMIKQIGGIDLDALVEGSWTPATHSQASLEPDQKSLLRQLVNRLTDGHLLADFGLVYDGSRVKMAGGTGAALIPKDAIDLLRTLCGSEVETPQLLRAKPQGRDR